MARGDEITTRFKVDVSDLKKGISDANQQIKLANAEFKKASAGMDDWKNSTDGVNAKLKQLDSVLNAQKSKLIAYQQELERNQKAYNENGERAEQLKAKLQQLADSGVSKASAEYKKYENELASVEKEQQNNQNAIDRLNVTILNQEAAVAKTEKEIRDYNGVLDSLESEQNDASKSADKLGDEVDKAGKEAKNAEGGFTVLKGALADLASKAVQAGINALKEFGKAAKEAVIDTALYGDAVDKNSQKVGLSYQEYQKWDYAMKIAGTSMENMNTGLKKLTTTYDSANSGSKTAVEQFNRLGLSMDDLRGKTREEMFETVVSSLQNVSDETERAALASKFFGRSGQELLPLLNQSAEETAKLRDEAVKYGMVLSDDAVKASADFKDSMTLMSNTMDGLKRNIAAEFLPGLTDVVQGISDLAIGAEGAGEKVGKSLGDVLTQAMTKVTSMLPEFGKLAVELITSLVKGISDSASEISGAAVTLVETLVNGILSALPDFVDAAIQLAAGLIQGLGQAIPNIVNKVLEILPALVEALLSGTDTLLNAAITLLSSIIDAIPSIVQNLVVALPQIINSITSFLTTSIPTLIQGGIQLFYALIDAIPQVLPPLLAALPQIITSLVNFLIQSRIAFMQAAVQLLMGLVGAIPEVVMALIAALPDIIQAILDGLSDIPSLLKDLFLSAWEGIKSVFSGVGDFFKNIFGRGKKNIEDEWSDMGQWSDNKNKEIEKPFENTDKYFGDKFAASATAMDKSFANVGTWADGKRKDVNKAFDSTDTWFGEKYSDAAVAMDKSFENVGSWADGKRKEVNTAFETTDEWFGKKYADSAAAMDKSFEGVGKWAEGKRKSVDNAFQNTDKWFGDKYEAAANQMDNSFKNVGSWAQGKRKSVDDAFASTDTFFKGKFDAAKSSMDTSWNDVGSWSEGKAQAMEKPFESVDDWFGKKFGETFKAIQDEFSGWESYWDSLYSTIVNKFKSIGTSVGSAIGGSFKTAMNAAMGAAQSAVNRGIDSINTAIGQMNAIQGVSVGRIGYVSFPRLARGGVLKKGQIGFLEGSGAEAVVPLDKNQKWISEVADDMVDALAKKTGSGGSAGKLQKQNTAEIKKLTKALEEQSKELDNYNEKLASTESQYIKNGDRIVKLTDKLETLKRNGVAESSNEYQKYATALAKAEEKQEKLETAIVNIYGSIENERNLIAETNAAISELDGTMQTNVTTTQSAAVADGEFGLSQDDVSAKVESLTGKLATQEERLEAYKKKLGDTEIAYVNNQARIDELTAKLENLQKNGVSPTSEEYLKYKDALDLAQQKQDYLQKSVDSLNVSIDFEQAAIVRTSGELSKYQGMQESNTQLSEEQAAAVQKIIDNMEKEGQTTDDLQARLSELNATLDAQQSKYDWTNAKLNKQTEALEAQSSKVDYLKAKMQQLADDGVSKTDAKYVKYAERLEKAEEKQSKLQESVAKLVTSSEKQETAIGKTTEEISNYEEALKALGVTQGSMTDYTDDQVVSNDKVRNSESALAAETESLDSSLKGINSTYQDMAKIIVDVEVEIKKFVEKSIASAVKATKNLGDGFSSLRKPINDTMTKLDQFETKLNTIYNTVIKKFKGIGSAVATGISNAFNSAMNAAMRSAEKAINNGIDSINAAIREMNNMNGGNIATIKHVSFPELARGGILAKGQVGFLEGTGAEAVVPLDKNKMWIRAVANDMLDTLRAEVGSVSSVVNNKDYNFTQNIYSPKAPSRIEIYRQTRNLLSYASQG